MIFDAPRRASISLHLFRKNGPFSSGNMSGAGTPTCEGVPKPKHIPFGAPNWRTIGHKFGVRAVSHVVVRCSDILAPDFEKMTNSKRFYIFLFACRVGRIILKFYAPIFCLAAGLLGLGNLHGAIYPILGIFNSIFIYN